MRQNETYRIGQRVRIVGDHPRAGECGTIVRVVEFLDEELISTCFLLDQGGLVSSLEEE